MQPGMSSKSNLKCPTGSEIVSNGFNDIYGCGLEGCDKRYETNYKYMDACKLGCDNYENTNPGINMNIYMYIRNLSHL